VLAKYSGRAYAKWLVHELPTPLSAKQIEDEKSKASSGIYEQVLKNAVVKRHDRCYWRI
jgi:hypothetical protein